MKQIKSVVRKEVLYFLRRRRQLGILLLFGIFILVVYLMQLQNITPATTSVVVFIGFMYGLLMLSFRSEQVNRAVGNLFASPVEFREVFFGKIAATFLFSYISELLIFIVASGSKWFRLGKLPPVFPAILVLLIIPIWGVLFAESLTLGYITLGNPIAVQIIGIGIMGLFFRTGILNLIGSILTTPTLPIFLGLVTITVSYHLIGNIDEEWLVNRWKYSAS